MEEISGIVEKIRVRKPETEFVVFMLRMGNRVVRVAGSDNQIYESDVVTCQGEWVYYQGDRQFKAKSIIPDIPTDDQALLAYLSSDRIPGIGKVFADRLIKKFGKDLVYIVENSPERLKEVKGFGPKKIKALIEGLRDQIGYRSILIFLHGFGISKRYVNKIYKTYGLSAVEKIKANPYSLCYEMEGIGFVIADKIAKKVGIKDDDPHRVMAGINYSLGNIVHRTGNTGVSREVLTDVAFKLFSGTGGAIDAETINDGISVLVESDFAIAKDIDGQEYVFPMSMYEAEEGIAMHFNRIMGCFRPKKDQKYDNWIVKAQQNLEIELADAQVSAVKMALKNSVSVITGGPGTGKTTIIRVFLEVCKTYLGFKSDDILLCAPTGKAAKRLSESSGMEAMTLHRALSFSPETGGFEFCEDNPLEAKIIVTDEASMQDTQLTYSFVQAISAGAQLVIVGDVDQLASVGPGKVLKDVIDSGRVPVTRLTDIYRQAKTSQIIVNAHRINRGEVPVVDNKLPGNDFWFVNSLSAQSIADQTLALISRMSKHYGYDPIEDIQVLTPQRKGPVGQYELNRRIQKLLNPNLGTGIKVMQDAIEVEYCVGDKVIHIKNNYDLGVFNGEVGRIRSVDTKAKQLVAQYDNRMVKYGFSELGELRLAYAMTIHKSQGSEYPCVIIPASTSHEIMLSRNLFYTGITRAKKVLTLVGEIRALQIAVERISSESRVTGLKQHLLEKLAA
ncbi:MAG: ATP-dependent RecD-like DNA helicase [Hafnia sp.]